jgi:hypothetical protein
MEGEFLLLLLKEYVLGQRKQSLPGLFPLPVDRSVIVHPNCHSHQGLASRCYLGLVLDGRGLCDRAAYL